MRAKSLWYIAPENVEIREIDLPEPGPGEVLVKVEVCGICTWDLFIFSGGFQSERAFPFYFGHEGIGRVVSCGSGVTLPEGQRVALRESKQIGAQGGGHMAEHSIQVAASLIILPEDEVPDHEFMVEPAACVVNALNISPVHPGERVALVGSGYMGSLILQMLLMSPAREIVVFEKRDEMLSYARSHAAGTSAPPMRVVDTREKPPDGTWLESVGPFDIVFEASAEESGFHIANTLVRTGGRFVIFSWQHHPIEIDFGDWHMRGLTVHNSSPMESWNVTGCFGQAVDLLHTRRIDQSKLITHVGPPEQAQQIYQHGIAKSDGYIKGVIRWS